MPIINEVGILDARDLGNDSALFYITGGLGNLDFDLQAVTDTDERYTRLQDTCIGLASVS